MAAQAKRTKAGRASAPPLSVPTRSQPWTRHFLIGMDVGSTTVKAVVIDAATDADSLVRLPAARHQAAGEGPGVLQAVRDRNRRLRRVDDSPHVHHRLGRQRPDQVPGRASSCRKSTPSRWPWRSCIPKCGSRHRTGRAGRQDHHLQDGPGDRPQEEDPVDERQVRRRYRRRHRQDQRQAAHSRASSFARWATRASSCIPWPASAACSPRPISTACRRWAFRPTS